MARRRILSALTLLAATAVPAAAAAPDAHEVGRMRAFMGEMRAESRIDARRIEETYGPLLGEAPEDRQALARQWRSGRIAALPLDERFNVRARLTGAHVIGEKDLRFQRLYVGARPAALGLLLEIAGRVHSGPLEVTSLVRHHAYQRALARSNPNARTSVPVHALGVAFDISILNASPATAAELRDVLRHMRADGALFFVAETQQLVFHVVLHPDRVAFYEALFEGLTGTPPPLRAPLPRLAGGPRLDDVLRLSDASVSGPALATILVSGSRPFAYVVVAGWLGLRSWRRRRRRRARSRK